MVRVSRRAAWTINILQTVLFIRTAEAMLPSRLATASPYHHRALRSNTVIVASREGTGTTTTATTTGTGTGGVLANAFLVGGAASSVAWVACAQQALATYKPWRIRHNSIGVAQALSALPIIWGTAAALSSATRATTTASTTTTFGEHRQFRRLSLGLAAASVWAAVGVAWSRHFTAAVVRTADPVVYAAPLVVAACSAHLGTALVCLEGWRRSVVMVDPSFPSFFPLGRFLSRVSGGVCTSLWRIGPRANSNSDRAAQYSTLAVSFGVFTLLSLLAPFPLATLPSLMGKRLARASGAWTWLAAVILFVLKEDAESGNPTPTPTTTTTTTDTGGILRRSVLAMSAWHLLVAVGRPLVDPDGAAVYPAAMACLPATVLSLLVFVLTVAATTTTTTAATATATTTTAGTTSPAAALEMMDESLTPAQQQKLGELLSAFSSTSYGVAPSPLSMFEGSGGGGGSGMGSRKTEEANGAGGGPFEPTQTREEQEQQILSFQEKGRQKRLQAREGQLEAAARMKLSVEFLKLGASQEWGGDGDGGDGGVEWLDVKEAFVQANLRRAVEDIRSASFFDEQDNLVQATGDGGQNARRIRGEDVAPTNTEKDE